MFDHPRINALDLRSPGKRLIGNTRKAAASMRRFILAYRKSQEWIEWDEITWDFPR